MRKAWWWVRDEWDIRNVLFCYPLQRTGIQHLNVLLETKMYLSLFAIQIFPGCEYKLAHPGRGGQDCSQINWLWPFKSQWMSWTNRISPHIVSSAGLKCSAGMIILLRGASIFSAKRKERFTWVPRGKAWYLPAILTVHRVTEYFLPSWDTHFSTKPWTSAGPWKEAGPGKWEPF